MKFFKQFGRLYSLFLLASTPPLGSWGVNEENRIGNSGAFA
jgi:hypothetical protein